MTVAINVAKHCLAIAKKYHFETIAESVKFELCQKWY